MTITQNITNTLSVDNTEVKAKQTLIEDILENTTSKEDTSAKGATIEVKEVVSKRSLGRKMATTLSARSGITREKASSRSVGIAALQSKIDQLKQMVKSTPMTLEEANTHLQSIFQDVKGLTPTIFVPPVIIPTETDFATPTEFATPTDFTAGDMFDHVRTYGMVGLWSLSKAEMRDIASTMDVQQSLMSLEEGVENLSLAWSDYYTKVLGADEQAVKTAAAGYAGETPQDRATAVNVATSVYNFDSTNMQTVSSNYSSQNNLLSNGVSNAGQNLSTDGATIQQVVMKVMDSLSQLLGSI